MGEKKKDRTARQEKRRESMQMSAAGAWDIASDAVANFSANSDANQAAAIALYAVLSAIPLFILTILAAGAFFSANSAIQTDIVAAIRNFHPYFSEEILGQLGQIEDKRRVLGWIGFLGLIWLSAAIFNAIESALNIIFRSRRKRNYVVSKLMAFCMIPAAWLVGGLSIFISTAAALLAGSPLILPGGLELSLGLPAELLLRYAIPYALVVALAALLYRFTPTTRVRPVPALVAGAAFALLLEIAKQFFTWYLTTYTRYHVIFGSLETIVILVIWVFYVSLIFLFCAEMLSSYERRDLLLLERALLKPRAARLKVDERLFAKFGRSFAKDSVIFRENDRGREMFYILSGSVVLERTDSSMTKTLARLGPGQYFGEMATLIDVQRTATARALADSTLAVIDDATLRDLIRENREAALYMLREFSARLKASNEALEEFTDLWSRLVVIVYFLDRPRPLAEDAVAPLVSCTRRTPAEIRTMLAELVERGILIRKDQQVWEVVREKMWSLFAAGTFTKWITEGAAAGAAENRGGAL
jgi:membrane protein